MGGGTDETMFSATLPVSPTKHMWGGDKLVDASTAREMKEAYSEWQGDCVREDGMRRYYGGVVLVQSNGDVWRFRVGDDVLVLAPKGMLPYIASIVDFFQQHGDGDKMVCLRWYYRSSEVARKKDSKPLPAKEVFASDYTDENSIHKRCYVLPHKLYLSERGEVFRDVFFCQQTFSPPTKQFKDASQHFASRDWQPTMDELHKRRSDLSYQEPKVGPAHQCTVPLFPARGRYAPSPERGEDELLFSPARAFGAQERPSQAAEAFLKEWEGLVPASVGINRQEALKVLSSCGHDLSKAQARMRRLQANGVPGFESGGGMGLRQSWRYCRGEQAELEAARVASCTVPCTSSASRTCAEQSDPSHNANAPKSAAVATCAVHPATPKQGPWSTAAASSPSKVTPPPNHLTPPIARISSTFTDPHRGGGVGVWRGEGGGQRNGSEQKARRVSLSLCLDSRSTTPVSSSAVHRANGPLDAPADVAHPDASPTCGGLDSVRSSSSDSAHRKRMSAFKAPPSFKRVLDGLSDEEGRNVKSKVALESVDNRGSGATGRGGAEAKRSKGDENGSVVHEKEGKENLKRKGSKMVAESRTEAVPSAASPNEQEQPSIFVSQAKCCNNSELYDGVRKLDTSKGKMFMSTGLEKEMWHDTSLKDIKNIAIEGELRGVSSGKKARGSFEVGDHTEASQGEGGGESPREIAHRTRKGGERSDHVEAAAPDASAAQKRKGAKQGDKTSKGCVDSHPAERKAEGITEKKKKRGGQLGNKRKRSCGAVEGDERGGRERLCGDEGGREHRGISVTPSVPSLASNRKNYSGPNSVSWKGNVWQIGDTVVIKMGYKTRECLACILGFSFPGTEPMIKCGWFYRQNDVPQAHRRVRVSRKVEVPLQMDKREVLVSTHSDVNSIKSIKGACDVFHEEEYNRLAHETKQRPRTYFFGRMYDITSGVCRPVGPDWTH
mmetsp:Transcript_18780/g.43338  ORF Transcript_18780/g.43338 Transcript_18780/m.43338 type:complete len:951 (-) Transcript_18780:293-3145(-)|eukprot:CAMPEP_0172020140 /NCGR_PEP_ID=MMETSP1041-20130122/13029_1 /TAXON_ID=464988 /ORGANISM="Hemiselmis andersenii, Strain CCMP439" /LENGTH=950 /DNA_ID=CAMNT_0012675397 /DNA_START=195 /DNA_END=3047 /DNA_ORIENTATION=+